MIVLIAGMQRSGSTFVYNVVREMLQRRGSLHAEALDDLPTVLSRGGAAQHILMKTHACDPLSIALARHGAARTICTVRPLDDAMASWLETFALSETEAIDHFRAWIAMYRQIRDHALVLPYSLIDRHPWRAAWLVGRYLRLGAGWVESIMVSHRFTKAKVKAATDRMTRDRPGVRDAGFTWYDETTLFHRRHVFSLTARPARQRIDPDQLTRLRTALARDAAEAGLASSGS